MRILLALALSVAAPSQLLSQTPGDAPAGADHPTAWQIAPNEDVEGALPPIHIVNEVRASGHQPLTAPVRVGATYVLNAQQEDGTVVRIVASANFGTILSIRVIGAAPPRPQPTSPSPSVSAEARSAPKKPSSTAGERKQATQTAARAPAAAAARAPAAATARAPAATVARAPAATAARTPAATAARTPVARQASRTTNAPSPAAASVPSSASAPAAPPPAATALAPAVTAVAPPSPPAATEAPRSAALGQDAAPVAMPAPVVKYVPVIKDVDFDGDMSATLSIGVAEGDTASAFERITIAIEDAPRTSVIHWLSATCMGTAREGAKSYALVMQVPEDFAKFAIGDSVLVTAPPCPTGGAGADAADSGSLRRVMLKQTGIFPRQSGPRPPYIIVGDTLLQYPPPQSQEAGRPSVGTDSSVTP